MLQGGLGSGDHLTETLSFQAAEREGCASKRLTELWRECFTTQESARLYAYNQYSYTHNHPARQI